VVKSLGIVLS